MLNIFFTILFVQALSGFSHAAESATTYTVNGRNITVSNVVLKTKEPEAILDSPNYPYGSWSNGPYSYVENRDQKEMTEGLK